MFFGSDLAGVSSAEISLDTMELTRGGKTAPGLKLHVDMIDTNEPDVLSTPDVFKALDDVESFDLLDFVFSQVTILFFFSFNSINFIHSKINMEQEKKRTCFRGPIF